MLQFYDFQNCYISVISNNVCVKVSMPSTQVAVEKRKISSIIEFFSLPQLTVNDTMKV